MSDADEGTDTPLLVSSPPPRHGSPQQADEEGGAGDAGATSEEELLLLGGEEAGAAGSEPPTPQAPRLRGGGGAKGAHAEDALAQYARLVAVETLLLLGYAGTRLACLAGLPDDHAQGNKCAAWRSAQRSAAHKPCATQHS
jgi:hypothetical protein